MPAILHIRSAQGESERPCGKTVTLGRTDTNQVPLPDPKVSRSHALIRTLGDGKYYIMDLGSANGTFVNDKRIVAPTALNDGDIIKLGDHVLTFEWQPDTVDITEADMAAQRTVLAVDMAVHRFTVLVSDIRSYTALSENVTPSFLAAVVGCWFRVTNEIAEKNGGVVDKYIGDAVMMRWSVPVRGSDTSVAAALAAAHELNLAAAAMNKDFADLPAPIRIGVGVNTGEAALGHVGGGLGRDYTALGDAVNLAFRFEEASKTLQRDVVLGPDSYRQLPDELWRSRLCDTVVKGKENPITVCALTFDELAGWLARRGGPEETR